ncbi:MAG: FAD-dependent oxidoreductase, partial [Spirulina sp. DLM2.Bin59]
MVYDFAVVGAGLAGLSIAQQIQAQDGTVVLLDKSRGVGGRVATRRLHETHLDHGLPYFQAQGPYTRQLIEQYAHLLHPWPGKAGTYVAPGGNTAIAKAMAADLTIHRHYCVTEILL